MEKKTVRSSAKIEGRVLLSLTEEEARALDAIVGYGPNEFVKWFYKNLGTVYLKPHEIAMRSLFETLRTELPQHLSKFDKARNVFEADKPINNERPTRLACPFGRIHG